MQYTPGLSDAIQRFWLPRPRLSHCMRGVMVRNTLHADLLPQQRLNFFPASPLCSLSWCFEGSGELLPSNASDLLTTPPEQVFGRMVLAGPRTQPSVTRNPGPLHGMMLMLMPDALHHMTGIDIPACVDRFVDVHDILNPQWLDFCHSVLQAPNDDARVERIQDFLEPLWQSARPQQAAPLHRYQDWAMALAMRAAVSGVGRSLRQIERRIKQWAGLPMRELKGIGRAEQAFFESLAVAETGGTPQWSAVAQSNGYADQSHLCRDTRRITGFAPQELYQRIANDEAFWVYRIWQ